MLWLNWITFVVKAVCGCKWLREDVVVAAVQFWPSTLRMRRHVDHEVECWTDLRYEINSSINPVKYEHVLPAGSLSFFVGVDGRVRLVSYRTAAAEVQSTTLPGENSSANKHRSDCARRADICLVSLHIRVTQSLNISGYDCADGQVKQHIAISYLQRGTTRSICLLLSCSLIGTALTNRQSILAKIAIPSRLCRRTALLPEA